MKHVLDKNGRTEDGRASPLADRPVWEDLVHDFLEVSASLRIQERDFLVDRLRQRQVLAERIELHPSFSIAGRLVVIHRGPATEECWLYDPARKKIRIGKI